MCPRLAVALLVLVACTGGDDDAPETCKRDMIVPVGLRNPYTGACEAADPGDDPCDPGGDGPPANVDWAPCDSGCEALDETACRAADGCQAIYRVGKTDEGVFFACWGTNADGPIHGVGCDTTDAEECSRRNDCSAFHDPGRFRTCFPEGLFDDLGG